MISDGSSSKLYWLPLTIFIFFPVTFATTYAIALSLDHIYAFFSYISDTGTLAPEMNVFAQMLNLLGVAMGFTAYVRYKQIETFFNMKEYSFKSGDDGGYGGSVAKYNKIGFVFGIIAALGASVVGNFQESNVLSVHVIGAFMAFGGGSIFLIFQAHFSFKMVPLFGSTALATLRMALGCTCLTLFIISYSTGTISFNYFTGEHALKWRPEHGGWALRVTSVTSEWIMAALFDLYFVTLVPEFKKITCTSPKFSFVHVQTVETKRQNGHSSQRVVMQTIGGDD